MSGIAHPSFPVRVRSWPVIAVIVTLLVAGAIVGVIALSSGDSASSSTSATHSSLSTGPNETARGNAAASAAGAQPSQTGGPNETARGSSAAGASRPLPKLQSQPSVPFGGARP